MGVHPLGRGKEKQADNLICRINQAAFSIVGTFRLIDDSLFGHEFRYYVPTGSGDREWEQLATLIREVAQARGDANGRLPFEEARQYQIKIGAQIRKMAERVVQLRVWDEQEAPPAERRRDEVWELCGLRKLLNPEFEYSAQTGIQTKGGGIAIL